MSKDSLRESIQVPFVKNNISIAFLNNSTIVQAFKTYCGENLANEREAMATAKIYRTQASKTMTDDKCHAE